MPPKQFKKKVIIQKNNKDQILNLSSEISSDDVDIKKKYRNIKSYII